MKETNVQKLKTRTYIDILLVVGPMILAHFIPAPPPLTPLGVQVLGIFIGMIYGWNACGMVWPSLVGILMLGMTAYGGTPQVMLAAALTDSVALSMIVCFVLFNFINASGISEVLAKWMITRKFTLGKPWVFTALIMLAGAILAGFLSTIVLVIICFEFLSPLLKKMGYTRDDIFPTYLYLGIAMNFATPSIWPSFLPKAIYTNGVISASLGYNFTTFQYFMLLTVPLFIMVVVYLILGKYILRIDTSKFAAGSALMLEEMERNAGKGLADKEKQGAIVLILFAVSMLIPAILPADWTITAMFSKLGMVGVSTILIVAMVVLRTKDGSTLTDFHTLIRATDWNVYMLTAAIMTIAGAVTCEESGIFAMLNALILPFLSRMPLVGFVVAILVIMCLLGQVCNTMVLRMVFAPALAQILLSAGHNPVIAVTAVYLGASMSMLAPSGSPMTAMVFARTEWVKPSILYRIAIPWIVLTMAIWLVWILVVPDMVCPM